MFSSKSNDIALQEQNKQKPTTIATSNFSHNKSILEHQMNHEWLVNDIFERDRSGTE